MNLWPYSLVNPITVSLCLSDPAGPNAIIYYNSAILSKLLEKYESQSHQKSLSLLGKISPVAWQHIHFQGHFKFAEEHPIDLDQLVKHLKLTP